MTSWVEPQLWRSFLWRSLLCLGLAGLGFKVEQRWTQTLAQVRGATRVAAAPADPRLPGVAVAVQASPHIAAIGSPHEPYDSDPPTSGPHVPWSVTPGVYSAPIPRELQVHALEHGHVLVQYAPGSPPAVRSMLVRVARAYPRDVIVAPYSRLPAGVVLTAWGRLERLAQPSDAVIRAFVVALRGRYNHGWRRE